MYPPDTTAPQTPVVAGDEPPAVVSLLAGRLDSTGYPATLLDLAARGWFGLAEPEPGRQQARQPPRLPLSQPEPAAGGEIQKRSWVAGAVQAPGQQADHSGRFVTGDHRCLRRGCVWRVHGTTQR